MKNIVAFLIAFFAIIPAFGRDIKGQILDENNAPLEFVNVALYCDSTFVAGGISDAEGLFAITMGKDGGEADRKSIFCKL